MQKVILPTRFNAFRKKLTRGKIIVLATGVFDILHKEHYQFLKKAKNSGDILIVGVESDKRVRKNKGKGRPVNNQNTRARVLSALKMVDYVVILPSNLGTKEGRESFIKSLKPDIYAVSSNTPFIKEKQRIINKFGGNLKVVHKHNPALSTTKLIEKNNLNSKC